VELRRLRHFVAVMEAGTVGGAARRVGLTQQALSTSIAQLEAGLGIELFQRTQRGMVPTLYAHHLLKHARHLLEDSARAVSALRALRTAESGEVRVGIAETMSGLLAATAIERVMQRMPGVTMSLTEGYSDQVLDLLLAGRLDVAVASPAASWLGHDELASEPLFTVRESVIARPAHPLARRRAVTLEDLQAAHWIQGRFLTESYEALCQAFAAADLAPPKHMLWSDAFASGLVLLLRNDFVTFTCVSLVAHEIERGALVELRAEQPRRERSVYAFHRRNGHPSPATERLLEELRGVAEQVATRRRTWVRPVELVSR
jgi:DNA-binding transcriptional LysR family regulator